MRTMMPNVPQKQSTNPIAAESMDRPATRAVCPVIQRRAATYQIIAPNRQTDHSRD